MEGVHEAGAISAGAQVLGVGVSAMVEPIAESLATTVTPAVREYPVTSIRPDNPVTRYLVDIPEQISTSTTLQNTVQSLSGDTASGFVSAVAGSSGEDK